MYGKTHLIIALAIILLLYNYLAYFIPIEIMLIYVGFCLLGSLLPDIDHHNGTIRKPYPALLSIGFIGFVLYRSGFSYYYIIPLVCLVTLLLHSYKSRHRTFTHSILGLFLFTLCIFPIYMTGTLYFFIGYSSHLLSDSITKAGVPFLYPLKKDNYGIKVIRTGKLIENIIFTVGILLCVYLAAKLFVANYSDFFKF